MLCGMRARVVLLVAALVACSSSPRPHLYPAGSDKDDGYGDLAQKSARFLTSTETEASLFPPHRHHSPPSGDPYGGDPYGGAAYGGTMYNVDDVSDAAIPKAWNRRHLPQSPSGTPTTGLTGAIEGTVTWRGAIPAPLVTTCGAVANPGVRVGANRAVGGVLVYIEHAEIGRTIPGYGRADSVGGTIAKRGCVLAPALQIISPLPAGLAIHGDATGVKLRVTSPTGDRAVGQSFELQEAGRVLLQAQAGVTRVEADDGSLGVAWVVATNTAYYAITDDTGRFRIDELPAGTYDVTVWRPPLASLVDGKLVYGPPVVTHRSIKVELARPAHLDVALEH
jgi:polysaccharide lyase family 4-like protein